MQFTDVFIDQVRSNVSIVDLIGGYVGLKKSGKDYAALCPFHQEKTPSFMISESKQIFKCFGCGVGGDVFKFVMLIENLGFPESIQYLAERHGIPIPQSSHSDKGDKQPARLASVMEIAAQFFQQALRENQAALDYLSKRQIDKATIQQFGIGYAPPGRRLLDLLKEQGTSEQEAIACGLVKEDDSGQHYDKFRNRIMFPIHNFSGKTIAFGGRVLGDGVPKYLNSPDTVLYKKSKSLYPASITRDEIRRRDFAILVEGYFDCVVPFQFGVRNIVASLGTSLTQDQVKILGRYTRNVVVNYDPDSAGNAAAMRSLDLFLAAGFRVNVLQLPGDADPDTFIRNEGKQVYLEKVKSSQPYLEFALSRFMDNQRDPFGPKGKQEIVSQILPYLSKIPNKVERAEYVSRVAARLRIDENLILLEIRKMPGYISSSTPEVKFPSLLDQITPAESVILTALLDEEWTTEVFHQLDPVLFEGLRSKEIFEMAFRLSQEQEKIELIRLRDMVTDEDDRSLLESVALSPPNSPISKEVIESSVLALRKKQYRNLSRQIQEKIKIAEEENAQSSRINELLVEKEEIHRKIKELEADDRGHIG